MTLEMFYLKCLFGEQPSTIKMHSGVAGNGLYIVCCWHLLASQSYVLVICM